MPLLPKQQAALKEREMQRFNRGVLSEPVKTNGHHEGSPSDPLCVGPTPPNTTQHEVLGVGCGVALGSKVEPFPVQVFPAKLQRFVKSMAKALPCPPDFPGVMMLPVLGACIGRKRFVKIKSSWQEYPLLWAAVVARSGERKTPAFKEVTEPLRKRQMKLHDQYRKDKKEYEAKARKDKSATPPTLQQTFTTDATIEALKKVLESNVDGVCYLADELSGWVRGMGQYKGGKGDDRQHWLSIHACTTIVCNRASLPEPIIIENPFVAVTGGIQPDCLSDLIDGREDGGAARILFAYPDPLPNKDWTEDVIEGADDYAGVCEALWDLDFSENATAFSHKAKARWVEWFNAHEREEPPDNLRAMWSKCEGHLLRLALILFFTRRACGETKATEIDLESVEGAVKLIAYFKSHARRVYHRVTENEDNGRITQALRWVRKQVALGKKVTARHVQMNGVCGCKTADEAKELLNDLDEAGHGKVVEDGTSFVFQPNTTQHPTPNRGQSC